LDSVATRTRSGTLLGRFLHFFILFTGGRGSGLAFSSDSRGLYFGRVGILVGILVVPRLKILDISIGTFALLTMVVSGLRSRRRVESRLDWRLENERNLFGIVEEGVVLCVEKDRTGGNRIDSGIKRHDGYIGPFATISDTTNLRPSQMAES
jgi:hypothetical protein